MALETNDYVIKDVDFEQLAGADKVAGYLDVALRGRGIAARMVMLCDAPSYVQCLVGGAYIDKESAAKGVLWMRINHPS